MDALALLAHSLKGAYDLNNHLTSLCSDKDLKKPTAACLCNDCILLLIRMSGTGWVPKHPRHCNACAAVMSSQCHAFA